MIIIRDILIEDTEVFSTFLVRIIVIIQDGKKSSPMPIFLSGNRPLLRLENARSPKNFQLNTQRSCNVVSVRYHTFI